MNARVNVQVSVMHSFSSSLVGTTLPGLLLAAAALLAALPPYLILSRASRGRARSAVGYLLGLAAGLVATAVCVVGLGPYTDAEAAMLSGLLASFFAPFAGMLRAKWSSRPRPAKRRRMMASLPGCKRFPKANGLSRPSGLRGTTMAAERLFVASALLRGANPRSVMRAFAFLLTAAGLAGIFIGVVLATITLSASTKERLTLSQSIVSN